MPRTLPRSVLVVAQNYRPEPIGSAPYIADLAEHLAAQGARVEALTSRPCYPNTSVQEGYRRGERDREELGGVDVHRVRALMPGRRGALGRLLSEGGFLVQGMIAVATGRIRRPDVVISLCPSIFAVLLGAIACRARGQHIAIVHDIQSGLASGLEMVGDGFMVRMLRRLEMAAFNRADTVLVLSDSMRRHLEGIGVRAPIHLLPIWIDTDAVPAQPERAQGGELTVMYSGNLGKKQALDQVLDMAALLKQRRAAVRVLLRGQGSEAAALKARAESEGLDNVRFEGLVPFDRFAESLGEGDIHLVVQNPHIADFAVPSKLYSIMSAARPVIAAAPRGSLIWQIQDRTGGIRCVPAGNAEALADAVQRLADDADERRRMAQNARRFVVAEHDRSGILESFLDHLDAARA